MPRVLLPDWLAAWANLRTDLLCLPYGDQGLLLRRIDYDEAGGYPDQPLMEDVALGCGRFRPGLGGCSRMLLRVRKNISSRAGCAVGAET